MAGCERVATCGAAVCCLWHSSDEESDLIRYSRYVGLKPRAHQVVDDDVDVASLQCAEDDGPRD